jgi:predicted Rossmann fold flavoprotein
MTHLDYDVAIIGAGAAGMMCGLEAGKRGRRVVILDRARKIGTKILISGGGRCNFTNRYVTPEAFVSQNPHFCKSALSHFTPDHFIKMVEAHGIEYTEKKLGQLFCTTSARRIVDMMVTECRKAGAEINFPVGVDSVKKESERFRISTDPGDFTCQSVVIATGGLSIPKGGATDFGYRVAREFGLAIVSTTPALDGFVLSQELQNHFCKLAGISIACRVSVNKASFRENLLFTHRGLSGPAMLQASLYWNAGCPVVIDLSPDMQIEPWILQQKGQGSRMEMKNLLASIFPDNFSALFTQLYFPHNGIPLVEIPDKALKTFAEKMHHWTLIPQTTVGYQKAEVTRGGVSTHELSSKTMEAKKVPGLYFIGEVVDVTGWLGGYNFQWAWASGWTAGQYV